MKLTTVPALNRADPALYGGCLLQNCRLDELVWPDIGEEHAAPGKYLPCPPPNSWGPGPGREEILDEIILLDLRGRQLRLRLRSTSQMGVSAEGFGAAPQGLKAAMVLPAFR